MTLKELIDMCVTRGIDKDDLGEVFIQNPRNGFVSPLSDLEVFVHATSGWPIYVLVSEVKLEP